MTPVPSPGRFDQDDSCAFLHGYHLGNGAALQGNLKGRCPGDGVALADRIRDNQGFPQSGANLSLAVSDNNQGVKPHSAAALDHLGDAPGVYHPFGKPAVSCSRRRPPGRFLSTTVTTYIQSFNHRCPPHPVQQTFCLTIGGNPVPGIARRWRRFPLGQSKFEDECAKGVRRLVLLPWSLPPML